MWSATVAVSSAAIFGARIAIYKSWYDAVRCFNGRDRHTSARLTPTNFECRSRARQRALQAVFVPIRSRARPSKWPKTTNRFCEYARSLHFSVVGTPADTFSVFFGRGGGVGSCARDRCFGGESEAVSRPVQQAAILRTRGPLVDLLCDVVTSGVV